MKSEFKTIQDAGIDLDIKHKKLQDDSNIIKEELSSTRSEYSQNNKSITQLNSEINKYQSTLNQERLKIDDQCKQIKELKRNIDADQKTASTELIQQQNVVHNIAVSKSNKVISEEERFQCEICIGKKLNESKQSHLKYLRQVENLDDIKKELVNSERYLTKVQLLIQETDNRLKMEQKWKESQQKQMTILMEEKKELLNDIKSVKSE